MLSQKLFILVNKLKLITLTKQHNNKVPYAYNNIAKKKTIR